MSQHWNIDLAQELEEYLEELEHVKITFDPSTPELSISANENNSATFNFAEAALVIQNTSAIYSRKVEYLYALVFQALRYLHESKKQTRRNEETNAVGQEMDTEYGHVFENALKIPEGIESKAKVSLTKRAGNEQSQRDEWLEMHYVEKSEQFQSHYDLQYAVFC